MQTFKYRGSYPLTNKNNIVNYFKRLVRKYKKYTKTIKNMTNNKILINIY